ncbi:MAG TPA: hypothetical protein VJ873_05250, partial [bacterium]|nr:hypothetical protein [bacterium]
MVRQLKSLLLGIPLFLALSTSGWALTFNSLSFGNLQANANGPITLGYAIGNGKDLKAGDYITVKFPSNTLLPSQIPASAVSIDQSGAVAISSVQVDQANSQVLININSADNSNSNSTLFFFTSAGIINPSCAGSYTMSFTTSQETAAVTTSSYTITANSTTSVNIVTAIPNPSVASAAAGYTVDFNLGAQGRLDTCSNQIVITFPSGTTVPNGTVGGIQVNGITASAQGSSSARTLTITSPLLLLNSQHVTIDIPLSAGIINPVPGSQTLKVHTSVETTDVSSSSFVIITPTTSLSAAAVQVDSNVVGDAADYTLDFVLSSSGALTGGSGTVTIVFPSVTTVPASIPLSDVFVDNGTFQENPAAISSSGTTVVITVPSDIPNSQDVEIEFDPGAGIVNPSLTNYYSLTLSTSKDAAQASNSYQIVPVPSTVSQALVVVSPTTASTAGLYTITFETGYEGQLSSGTDSVILAFPSDTTVPNGSLSGILLNGLAASATGNSTNRSVTLTMPTSLNASSSVSISIPTSANILNPSVATSYNMTVSTTRETTGVLSGAYAIGSNTPIGVPTVTLSNAAANAFSTYTISFTQPTKNVRQESLFFFFPYNTNLPNGISTSNVTIKDSGTNTTPYNPVGVSVDQSTGEIIIQDQNSHN